MSKYRALVLNKNTFNLQTVFFQCDVEDECQAYLDERFPLAHFIHNPDLSLVDGLPTYYWDIDFSGNVVPKSQEERNYTDNDRVAKAQADHNADMWRNAWDVNFSQISGAANGLMDRLYDAGAPKGSAVKNWVLGLWNDYYYRKGQIYGHTLAAYSGDVDACINGIRSISLSFTGWLPMPYTVGEILQEGVAYGVI